MAAAPRTRYSVEGENRPGGAAAITSHASTIDFDGTATSGELLPSPADLLAAALAACILKNVERFAGAREKLSPTLAAAGAKERVEVVGRARVLEWSWRYPFPLTPQLETATASECPLPSSSSKRAGLR
jgi:hypothetical protein